jgi:hypothetical protein
MEATMPKPSIFYYPQPSQQEQYRRFHRPILGTIWGIVVGLATIVAIDEFRSGNTFFVLLVIVGAGVFTVLMWHLARVTEPRSTSLQEIGWSISWKNLFIGAGIFLLGIILTMHTEDLLLTGVGICLVFVGFFWAFVSLRD